MGHKIYLLICTILTLYLNYRALKMVWTIVMVVHTASEPLIRNLTPQFVINWRLRRSEMRVAIALAKRNAEIAQIRIEHYDFRFDHFVNLKFVEQDRAVLFAGHPGIKWQYGRKSIVFDQFSREESHRIHFMMLMEIAIYRSKFIEAGMPWTDAQEKLWRKMIPKKYNLGATKGDSVARIERQAIEDFENDRESKIVC